MKEIPQGSIIEPTGEPPVIGSIHSIPLSAIHPMPNNPFQVRDDPAMTELIESISQFGILVPVEVRPSEYGDYEMISGSRRHHACTAAGLDSVPAIILHLDDDDAIIRMVDSNIQRENILPSERAHAYKMRMEAIKCHTVNMSKEHSFMLYSAKCLYDHKDEKLILNLGYSHAVYSPNLRVILHGILIAKYGPAVFELKGDGGC